MLEVYAYNAGKGDCIRIHFGEGHNVFIDSGISRFAESFRRICGEIKDEHLDVMILTHVDNDHIGGILSLLRCGYRCPFNEVWMNHKATDYIGDVMLSTRENDEVYARLVAQGITVKPFVTGDERKNGGAIFKALNPEKGEKTPTNRIDTPLARHSDYGITLDELAEMPIIKRDSSANNKDSVVFTIEYEGRRLLFTGDAWAEDVVKAQGFFDLVKLPHHGAVGNISDSYPQNLRAANYLICTDGRDHPDKQTIVKLEKWYGEINIFSSNAWWRNGYFVGDDRFHSINYFQKEGLIIAW